MLLVFKIIESLHCFLKEKMLETSFYTERSVLIFNGFSFQKFYFRNFESLLITWKSSRKICNVNLHLTKLVPILPVFSRLLEVFSAEQWQTEIKWNLVTDWQHFTAFHIQKLLQQNRQKFERQIWSYLN